MNCFYSYTSLVYIVVFVSSVLFCFFVFLMILYTPEYLVCSPCDWKTWKDSAAGFLAPAALAVLYAL